MKHYSKITIILFFFSSIHAMETNFRSNDRSSFTIEGIGSGNIHEKIRELNDVRLLMLATYEAYEQHNRFRTPKKYLEDLYSSDIKDLMNSNAQTQLYVAKHNQEVVGFVTWSNRLKENNSFLRNIAVANNYRNMGIGKKLALLPFEEVYNTQSVTVSFDVMYGDAIKFFNKIGFKKDPRMKAFTNIHTIFLIKENK